MSNHILLNKPDTLSSKDGLVGSLELFFNVLIYSIFKAELFNKKNVC